MTKRKPNNGSAEKTVRDIRRATRRHYNAEEKIRIVLEDLVRRIDLEIEGDVAFQQVVQGLVKSGEHRESLRQETALKLLTASRKIN